MTPAASREVRHAAEMWKSRRNSWDIAKALKMTEPEALQLLERARALGMIPGRA